MDDLLADFVAETREMLEALGGEIVAWETDPGDRERLDAIFRFVHTVKGNCGFFDFPRLQALSHAAEDTLADLRSGQRSANAQLVTAVLSVIDRIADMVEAIDAGIEFPEGGDEALIAGLQGDGEAEAVALLPAASPTERASRAAAQRSIRLPVELLDRVMSGVSDIVLARNELARRLRELPDDTAINGPFERLSAMIADVRERMTMTRMQPLETLFGSLPRMVRDLSMQLGKQVMIDTDGSDVELDREMIELVRDPIIHIIRNAIDHGIEPPAKRLAAGKREIGMLGISARQSGNQILIQISDDGRGINADKLVEKSVAAGIITSAEAAAMSPRERNMLICEAGLSTTEAVTEISGRGVGMDVVRANIEQIGGSVEIDSAAGRGTRISLRLPLTLSITPSLIVEAAGQKFAIPRSYVEEIVDTRGNGVEFSRIGDALLANVRDRRLPCLSLDTLLGLETAPFRDDHPLAVIRLTGGDLFALAVDRLLDHEELVVKPIAPALMATGFYAGTTLTDDGRPILLLDVTGLARAGGLDLEVGNRTHRRIEQDTLAESSAHQTQLIVFTGIDGRRKALRMAVVERIEEADAALVTEGGERRRIVLGDCLFPLAGTDGQPLPPGLLRILRLGDGASALAYACRDDADIVSVALDGATPAGNGEIESIVLIDGAPVEVIDSHWLFARHGEAPAIAAPPVCRLPEHDRWAQDFLRPVIEAAGYRVVGEADEAPADVAIATESQSEADMRAAHVIRLRALPELAAGDADTLYRYDRDGLIAALGAARGKLGRGAA